MKAISSKAPVLSSRRPPYTPVKLWYESDDAPVAGQYIQAQSRTHATYLIQAVRPSPSIPGMYSLSCLRWPPHELPLDAVVLPLYWAKREKKVRPPRAFPPA